MSKMRVKTLVVGMVETNCYLVYNEETKQAVIVDPGDNAERISRECQALDLKPEMILLTHGHFDHIMAAKELKARWGLKIAAAKKEVEILTDCEKNLVTNYYRTPFTLTPDITLSEGEILGAAGFAFRVLETPGHTVGSCCYYVEDEEVLFSGDTLFQMSYGRIDFPTGSSRDMVQSVKRLLSTLPENVMVYPGHMDATSIGFEKKYNPLARY